MANCCIICVYVIITSYIDMKSGGFYEGKKCMQSIDIPEGFV